jgi:hypothetical protein
MMMMMMTLNSGHHHQSQQRHHQHQVQQQNGSNSNSSGNNPPHGCYNVYMLYQKEVYNTDHAYLQSMLDWLYTSIDSPYKFIIRNKCQVCLDAGPQSKTASKPSGGAPSSSIIHQSIRIQNLTSNNTNGVGFCTCQQSSNSDGSACNYFGCCTNNSSAWQAIQFNLKYLKEIYVDKRHKDTCVLVSRNPSSNASASATASLSQSTSNGTTPNNNVWKKCNPSNYQSFRTPYSLNHTVKKAYLLTILKFKEGGPSKLLNFIQSLDSLLATSTPSASSNNSNGNQSSVAAGAATAGSSSFKNVVYGGSMTSLSSGLGLGVTMGCLLQQQQPQQANIINTSNGRNVNFDNTNTNGSSANVTASAFKHRPSLQEYYRLAFFFLIPEKRNRGKKHAQ